MFQLFRSSPFKNKFVQITTKTRIKATYEDASKNPVKASTALVVHGYYISEDNDKYFLGNKAGVIDFAVQKSEVILIEKLTPKTEDQLDEDEFNKNDKKTDFFYGGTQSKFSS